MSTNVVVLHHWHAHGKGSGPGQPLAGPERPVDPATTLATGLRSYLAVEDALMPWSDSALIAGLAGATPEERAAIEAELEARAKP